MPNLKSKLLIITTLALLVSSIGQAYAKHYSKGYSQQYSKSYSKARHKSYKNNSRYAQDNVRSRSDVMQEVKQRYNAKVLKISLNEEAGVYYVRMLMPSGKVRSIKVNAR